MSTLSSRWYGPQNSSSVCYFYFHFQVYSCQPSFINYTGLGWSLMINLLFLCVYSAVRTLFPFLTDIEPTISIEYCLCIAPIIWVICWLKLFFIFCASANFSSWMKSMNDNGEFHMYFAYLCVFYASKFVLLRTGWNHW